MSRAKCSFIFWTSGTNSVLWRIKKSLFDQRWEKATVHLVLRLRGGVSNLKCVILEAYRNRSFSLAAGLLFVLTVAAYSTGLLLPAPGWRSGAGDAQTDATFSRQCIGSSPDGSRYINSPANLPMFMLLIVIADLILTFCPFGRLGAYDRLGRNLTGLIGAILPAAYGVVQ